MYGVQRPDGCRRTEESGTEETEYMSAPETKNTLSRMDDFMRKLIPVAATAALMLGGAGAAAAELPTFETMGFPITPHQVQVVGAARVQERSPTPTLMLGGMPASPHQVAVLTPRPRMTEHRMGML
jgi:hypothetical protein